jgi:hypothetical protein
VLLFYTQLGYYGQFAIQQWLLKEAAREAWIAALPDSSFFSIRLADVNAAGKWEEEGKECWYHDHLYDVIRQKTIGGTVLLFCIDDLREARLIRQSGEVTHANHDHPDKKASHSLFARVGDIPGETISLEISYRLPIQSFPNSHVWQPLPIRYTEIVIPPPKI